MQEAMEEAEYGGGRQIPAGRTTIEDPPWISGHTATPTPKKRYNLHKGTRIHRMTPSLQKNYRFLKGQKPNSGKGVSQPAKLTRPGQKIRNEQRKFEKIGRLPNTFLVRGRQVAHVMKDGARLCEAFQWGTCYARDTAPSGKDAQSCGRGIHRCGVVLTAQGRVCGAAGHTACGHRDQIDGQFIARERMYTRNTL